MNIKNPATHHISKIFSPDIRPMEKNHLLSRFFLNEIMKMAIMGIYRRQFPFVKGHVIHYSLFMLVIVNDLMQKNYQYHLTEPEGENYHSDFKPDLTPKEMLQMGVFGGKYMTDCREEFPDDWFIHAKLCHDFHDPDLNYFKINASKSLNYWIERGWIYPEDPRGWFQWYCRYYMGRRSPYDEKQIKRWKQMVRHIAQLKKNCGHGDLDCRRKQRQALLHWAYDSRKF